MLDRACWAGLSWEHNQHSTRGRLQMHNKMGIMCSCVLNKDTAGLLVSGARFVDRWLSLAWFERELS